MWHQTFSCIFIVLQLYVSSYFQHSIAAEILKTTYMSQTSEIYSLYLLQSCNLTYLVSCVAASDIAICTLQFVVVHQHAPTPLLGCWIILWHCQSSCTKTLIQSFHGMKVKHTLKFMNSQLHTVNRVLSP